jgi:pimeloyl-ACP methyl ester carboxylesterase
MSPTTSTLRVAVDCGDVVVHRWSGANGRRPVALLVHGTGFCGSVWHGVAERLVHEFDVYAIDRRGHGASATPVADYDFADFADDTARVCDALDLRDAFAVGHSAGATDLLLAAARRPEAFRRLFLIEPTVTDPDHPAQRPELTADHERFLAALERRRTSFPSTDDVIDRYRDRGIFEGWRPDLLDRYVRDAFEPTVGGVTLRCTPAIERQMLLRIFAAMEGTYRGDARGNPFATLHDVECPITLATTERSAPVYGEMASEADRLLRDLTLIHFADVGHAVAQVAPERVADAALAAWHRDPVRTRSAAPAGRPGRRRARGRSCP